MINIVKILSSSITKRKRILKFLRLGKSDVQTSFESMPYGIDSAPLKDMKAVYMNTGEKGKSVIVGYINPDQIAEPGELRLFSDFDGFIYLKKNGNIEFKGANLELNGSSDNAIAHTKLQTALTAYNAQIVAELTKIATAITSVGGTYVPGAPAPDISTAKVNNVKLP